jgi:hypothetical protein
MIMHELYTSIIFRSHDTYMIIAIANIFKKRLIVIVNFGRKLRSKIPLYTMETYLLTKNLNMKKLNI